VRNQPDGIARLAALPWEDYWATPWWKKRRYAFDPTHANRVREQADQMRGRGGDPTAERTRDRQTLAEERIAWERTQGNR
jgi:hypothetical protein